MQALVLVLHQQLLVLVRQHLQPLQQQQLVVRGKQQQQLKMRAGRGRVV
jgi:hypothetical protein